MFFLGFNAKIEDYETRTGCKFFIIGILVIPWLIYHFALINIHSDNDFDWMKREEAELKSATKLFNACIDDQYAEILQLHSPTQYEKIEQYVAKHRFINIICFSSQIITILLYIAFSCCGGTKLLKKLMDDDGIDNRTD